MTLLPRTDGQPVLGPEAGAGFFTIGNSISLNGPSGPSTYLDINTSATTEYLPVYYSPLENVRTESWRTLGDTILDGNNPNFVVCPVNNKPGYLTFYLQEGIQSPSESCTNFVTIHRRFL